MDEEEVGGVINVEQKEYTRNLVMKGFFFQLKTFDVEIIVVLFISDE